MSPCCRPRLGYRWWSLAIGTDRIRCPSVYTWLCAVLAFAAAALGSQSAHSDSCTDDGAYGDDDDDDAYDGDLPQRNSLMLKSLPTVRPSHCCWSCWPVRCYPHIRRTRGLGRARAVRGRLGGTGGGTIRLRFSAAVAAAAA